jgi:hypothetical protein
MAEIRLNSLMRQFNIGLDTIVNFVRSQGVWVDNHPNAKIPDILMPSIHKEFGHDMEEAQAAAEIKVKLTSILDNKKGRRKVFIDGSSTPQNLLNRKRIALSRQKTEIPSAPSLKKTPRWVTIKAINRPSRLNISKKRN